MQSWGSNSLFWHRETGAFPTKSGVIGLLFCALGWGGEQTEALAEIAPLPQTVFQIGNPKEKRAPLMTDFHMVGGGYDDTDPWELECIPKTSAGKKAVNGGARLTRREYLQDASFAVILGIPEQWSAEVLKGFSEPVWDIYLGRKCCAPVLPVFGGLFDTEDVAREFLKKEITDVYGEGAAVLAVWSEVPLGTPGSQLVRDVPLTFGKSKKYYERAVIKLGADLSD